MCATPSAPDEQQEKQPKFIISYDDLQYINDINWYLELQIVQRKSSKINIDNWSPKVRKWYLSMFDPCKNERGALCLDAEGQALLNRMDDSYFDTMQSMSEYSDRNEVLICAYLRSITSECEYDSIPKIIFAKCRSYYHPSTDAHKNSTHLSHLSQIDNSFYLNVYDMQNSMEYNVNVVNMMKHNTNMNREESILLTVDNASIPKWIQKQFANELINASISPNDNDLSLLFVKSVEWDNYVIIVDNQHVNGYNFAIPCGTDIVSEMYGMTKNNILCIDDEQNLCDYSIDADEYNKFTVDGTAYYAAIPSHSKQDSIGCGVCTFDHGTKMFMVCCCLPSYLLKMNVFYFQSLLNANECLQL